VVCMENLDRAVHRCWTPSINRIMTPGNIGLRELFRIQVLVRDKISRMCEPLAPPTRPARREVVVGTESEAEGNV
jgi:hypothetical protein